MPWNIDDDMNWNKGRVWCIAGHSSLDNDNHLCKTANGPPPDCPFKMEHVILGQKL